MTKMLSNARRTLLLYKLSIARFFLFVISTICASVQTALAGAEWATMSHQSKLMICIGVSGTVASTITAFFDKSAAKIASGEPYLPYTPNLSSPP
jgi:hypothetical protein